MRRHQRFGWWSLLGFLVLGIVIELLHEFNRGSYLDASNETRRMMWRLAHAHGVLLALVHVAFSLTIRVLPHTATRLPRFASPTLMAATLLLRGGFFFGGAWFHEGDPGRGIFLVPVGALLLLIAVFLTAWGTLSKGGQEGEGKREER